MRAANLALRFLLELIALGVTGWWGATLPASPAVRVVAAIGAPLAIAVFWGTFVAPRARIVLPTPARMALGLAVFALAGAALAARGHRAAALVFAIAAVVNVALMLAWKQDRVVADR